MRFNANELTRLSQELPDWEGKLYYIAPEKTSQSSAIKSRARSAAKLGNGLVKSIAGVGVTGQVQQPASCIKNSPRNNGRERWFRIKANLLFYFRLTPEGRKPLIPGTEPLGVFVLEHFHVQKEGFEDIHNGVSGKNQFSLIFADEPDKRHFFIAENQQRVLQWETAMKQASYQRLRERLVDLQIKLRHKTGEDPLKGSTFQNNPLFSTKLKSLPNTNTADAQEQAPYSFSLCVPTKAQTMPTKIVPPPRSKKSKNKKTFQSHIVNDWESMSPIVIASEATEEAFMEPVNDRAATFHSHIPKQASVEDLIQF